MLVSLQHDDKWTAKGQFRLQMIFSRKDWGEFQDNTFLTERSYQRLRLKTFEQQKRPLLSVFRWPARIAVIVDVAILCAVGYARCKTRESP